MNGHLRFILLKEQLLDALHQWLARQLPQPVILLATLHLWATVTTEERADITEAINAIDKIAIYAAFVSGLPINNFIISKSVASSATLRQGEADLVAHVNALQRLWGRSWSKVFELFRIMEGLYGDQQFAPSTVRPIWAPPETVNIEGRVQEAKAQKETGVPVEFIWRHVWGYTEKEVDAMQQALAVLGNQGTADPNSDTPGAAHSDTAAGGSQPAAPANTTTPSAEM